MTRCFARFAILSGLVIGLAAGCSPADPDDPHGASDSSGTPDASSSTGSSPDGSSSGGSSSGGSSSGGSSSGSTGEPGPSDDGGTPGQQDLELKGNPGFSETSLPDSTRVWYTRLLNGLNNPKQYPNAVERGASGDLYAIGRFVNDNVTSTLTVFRLTGDLRLLDAVDKPMQAARKELKDYNDDGYPNWRWLMDSSVKEYYGDDFHVMDELMTHGLVAAVAWAFHQNASLTSPGGVDYAERATFWANYLTQWEAKWRKRNKKPTGFPFIYKNLTHPYLNLVRYLWYSHRLTNDPGYLNEAKRLADDFNNGQTGQLRAITTPNGPGLVFPHGIVKFEPSLNYYPPVHYARYSTQVLMDLALDGFPTFTVSATLVPLANTIATRVVDNGSTDFAPSLGGNQASAGFVPPAGEPRTNAEQWSIYPIGEYAAYDKSGAIAAADEGVYAKVEGASTNTPKRIAMPAAMVLRDLLKK